MQSGEIGGAEMEKAQSVRLRHLSPSISNVRAVFQNMIISSDYTEGAEYHVDCLRQTCSCEDFRKRSHMPTNDWRRWCKHLVRGLYNSGAFDGLNNDYAEILRFGVGGPGAAYALEILGMPTIFLLVSDSDEWLSVLARQKESNESAFAALGSYRRYGWSIYQKRWSYMEGPPGQSRINHFLKSIESWADLTIHTHRGFISNSSMQKRKVDIGNDMPEHEQRLAFKYISYLDILFFIAVQDGKICSHDLRQLSIFLQMLENTELLDQEAVQRILRIERKHSRNYNHSIHKAKFFKALDVVRDNPKADVDFIKRTIVNMNRGNSAGQNHDQMVAEDMVSRRLGRDGMPFNPRWQLY